MRKFSLCEIETYLRLLRVITCDPIKSHVWNHVEFSLGLRQTRDLDIEIQVINNKTSLQISRFTI